MKHPNLQVDERSAAIFGKVYTRLYLATIGILWLDVLYRQLWLGQPVTAFMDIAILMIANKKGTWLFIHQFRCRGDGPKNWSVPMS